MLLILFGGLVVGEIRWFEFKIELLIPTKCFREYRMCLKQVVCRVNVLNRVEDTAIVVEEGPHVVGVLLFSATIVVQTT